MTQVGWGIIIFLVYFGISLETILVKRNCNVSFLNPLRNYDEWYTMNWFGIGVITILLNIICLPYSIIYWVYKLIYWLFTVGRQ